MNNQAFSKIWIMVILVVVIAGGFFAWQYFGVPKEEAKDETVDWNTYRWRNLEFKYPSTWTVEKSYYQTPAQQAQGESPENIGLAIFPGTKSMGNDFISIGGRQVSCDPLENHTKCQLISSISDFIYTDSKNPDILKIFDRMLSTLKFIESEETADWKIYRNELLGFSLKVPLEYQRSYVEPQTMYPVYELYTDDKEQAMEERNGKFVASQLTIIFTILGDVTLEETRQSIEEVRALNVGEKTREEITEKIKNIDIDGCKGTTFQELGYPGGRLSFACLLDIDTNEAVFITITITSKREFIDNHRETHDKIVSTLRFFEGSEINK